MPTDLLQRLHHLERMDNRGWPVLSLYLNTKPGVAERSTLGARLRNLIRPLTAAAMAAGTATVLRPAIGRVFELESRMMHDTGRGIAIFVCKPTGLDEYLTTPPRLWDGAVFGPRPYLRPLRAVVDEFRRVAAVVVDQEKSQIMITYMGQILAYQVVEGAEPIRQANFGGWYGLEEYRTHRHAEETHHRHYRSTAKRLHDLY